MKEYHMRIETHDPTYRLWPVKSEHLHFRPLVVSSSLGVEAHWRGDAGEDV